MTSVGTVVVLETEPNAERLSASDLRELDIQAFEAWQEQELRHQYAVEHAWEIFMLMEKERTGW